MVTPKTLGGILNALATYHRLVLWIGQLSPYKSVDSGGEYGLEEGFDPLQNARHGRTRRNPNRHVNEASSPRSEC